METSLPPQELSLLDRLRNMWQFSNLMQYIFIFGKAVKIDEDFDIEVHSTQKSRPPPRLQATVHVLGPLNSVPLQDFSTH